MSEMIQIGTRGKQILKSLLENGPLSRPTLNEVIDPSMKKRDLNAAIKRLFDVGLIKNRHSSVSKFGGRFLELSEGEFQKNIIADILKVAKESLDRIPGGTEALEHWQECTIWSNRLSKCFPEAVVIRDFQIAKDDKALNTLLMDKQDMDLIPDMLLRFPKVGEKGSINVGIEIERTQKSKFRIIQKLRKFASRTRLDTVLYICSTPQLAHKISKIYSTYVSPKALRVHHYANNFLLTSDGSHKHKIMYPIVENAESKFFSLVEWIQFLRTHDNQKRAEFYSGTRTTDGACV